MNRLPLLSFLASAYNTSIFIHLLILYSNKNTKCNGSFAVVCSLTFLSLSWSLFIPPFFFLSSLSLLLCSSYLQFSSIFRLCHLTTPQCVRVYKMKRKAISKVNCVQLVAWILFNDLIFISIFLFSSCFH